MHVAGVNEGFMNMVKATHACDMLCIGMGMWLHDCVDE